MEERLQKLLSRLGYCSRRQAEAYLLAGRLAVNGKAAGLGDKADLARDAVTLDGKPLRELSPRLYLMLHKPRGFVSTLADERGRKTVAQLVEGCGARVWPVGRLDMDSEGLLILCNDGALTQRLTHPSHEVEKEYHAWVTGDVPAALPILRAPMCLEGENMRPAQVSLLRADGQRSLLSVTIHEGKNRQVRRMCAFAGLDVRRLLRVREGALLLDQTLKPGAYRPLTEDEYRLLTR